ncbi:sigma-54-dependent transcriptional regulator [Halochromatium sp.]
MAQLEPALDPLTKVLIIEDSLTQGAIYRGYLRDQPYSVTHVPDGRSGMAAIEREPPLALLLDLQLPDIDGMEILQHIYERKMPIAVVVITAHGSVDRAVDAMRYGAFDFIEKPLTQKRVLVTLRNAIEQRQMSSLVERLRDDFQRERYYGFIGSSLPMQAVYRIIDSAAPSRATLFITGESGTGKEVCAQAIHRRSGRNAAPFVAINCAAIPRDLMESEIFGHVKGSFTGAVRDRAGAAKQADGGTLFLDEISELDLDLQAKLLRFVQSSQFQPVGANREEKVDVRLVCATNRDPFEQVAAGRFREDLFYRLHVIPIHLPPLRERNGDILQLAHHFLYQYSSEEGKQLHAFDPEVEGLFVRYRWPGNVRQLQNVIQHVVVLHDADCVTRAMLPAPLSHDLPLSTKPSAELNIETTNGATSRAASGATLGANADPSANPKRDTEAPSRRSNNQGSPIRRLKDIEREAIESAIDHFDGNIPQAAAALGVSPSTIYRKRQTWDTDAETDE